MGNQNVQFMERALLSSNKIQQWKQDNVFIRNL